MEKKYIYRVERPCLWFYTGQWIKKEDLSKWFKDEAVCSLLDNGYLSFHKVTTSFDVIMANKNKLC